MMFQYLAHCPKHYQCLLTFANDGNYISENLQHKYIYIYIYFFNLAFSLLAFNMVLPSSRVTFASPPSTKD